MDRNQKLAFELTRLKQRMSLIKISTHRCLLCDPNIGGSTKIVYPLIDRLPFISISHSGEKVAAAVLKHALKALCRSDDVFNFSQSSSNISPRLSHSTATYSQ
ncbi:hypothetical protein T4A_3173 [Trichinella pseudospiralis]|uniref:Uncharacterized protein n=1 Tax=Trichinella pseudospiralis TaxID=6337 RepID=A0A0V1E1V2_TRIPS|nr:hypothetical protein T4A_3173 [Trichinella pseudospiralis]KRY84103.1 hypothetical protein T4D_11518 [Trichinella pseudospiralis]KRZ39025.1 hypothetical protein T4C_5189 [Trichinella pseudospiralis]